jgi:hypothetical protein
MLRKSFPNFPATIIDVLKFGSGTHYPLAPGFGTGIEQVAERYKSGPTTTARLHKV